VGCKAAGCRARERERRRGRSRGEENNDNRCSAPASPRHGGTRGTEALGLGVVRGALGLERSNGAEQRGKEEEERDLGRAGVAGA
jgi:hypothetical protein